MTPVFADTGYWIGLLSEKDQWHEQAVAARDRIGARTLVTTDEVLTECLSLMCEQGAVLRKLAVELVRAIMDNPNVRVLPQSRSTFLRALNLFEKRSDKSYSLVDCSSMAAMRSEGLTEVVSTDDHFRQDGFVNLLK